MIMMSHAMIGAAGYVASGGSQQVAVFDAASYITCGDVPVLDGAAAFTIAGFSKRINTGATLRLVMKWDATNEFILTYDSTTGRTVFGVSQDGSSSNRILAESYATILANEEHHIAVTWGGGTDFAFYVGGVAKAVNVFSVSGSVDAVSAGANHLKLYENTEGTASDIRIYDAALSATDIATLASQRNEDVLLSNLRGWWKLDGDLLDYSGNDFHGSAVGTVTFEDAP